LTEVEPILDDNRTTGTLTTGQDDK